MDKRGVDQMMWIIITIVIALIVMTVLLVLFGRNVGPIAKANTCAERGGQCAKDIGGSCNAQYNIPSYYDDCATTKGDRNDRLCCLSLGGS